MSFSFIGARILIVAVVTLAAAQAFAVQPNEMLRDPALESRARKLSSELRCLVCQNQSIDDSDAPLAHDLRVLVRERISAGDSDGQVKDFLVARYGEFVLLRPSFSAQTVLLWTAPFLVLIAGGVVALASWRRRATAGEQEPAPLTAEEQARLDRINAA